MMKKLSNDLKLLEMTGELFVLISLFQCLAYFAFESPRYLHNTVIFVTVGASCTLASQIKSQSGLFKTLRHALLLTCLCFVLLFDFYTLYIDLIK